MSQSLAQIYLHIVFSTKHRQPFLKGDQLLADLHAYLAGTCNRLEAPAIKVGGTCDHVHILCRLSRNLSPADLIRELKRESSKWVKTKGVALAGFSWQAGYGAFSISPTHVDALAAYIANQAEHHKQESFQDEFRRLLEKYKIEYDERYVWD